VKGGKMNMIYPQYDEPGLLQENSFEIKSFIGRHFKKYKSKITPGTHPLLLDLGFGANYTDGWTHVDFYSIRLKFWKKYQDYIKPDIETDLRYPLNCHSDIVDGVYLGHTLEHFHPFHAYKLLGEIFRVLKGNCWLRVIVPDLKTAVDFYNGKINIPTYKFKAEAIGNLTQNHGHRSVWDEELLTKALEITGFINVRKVEFRQEGTDKRLIKEEEARKHETLVIEAQKP
jgi:predicted SAM-dependent methyltransferase